MMLSRVVVRCAAAFALAACGLAQAQPKQMEKLGRGLVALQDRKSVV